VQPWKNPITLDVVSSVPNGSISYDPAIGVAVVTEELDEVRSVCEAVTTGSPVRVLIAPHIPSQVVTALASEGVASFQASNVTCATLSKGKKLELPKPTVWGVNTSAMAGKIKVQLKWLAIDLEQQWTHAGRSTKTTPAPARKPA
jgi:hypothetical protein